MSLPKPGDHVMTFGPNDDYVGKLVEYLPGKMVALTQASWVANSGRLATFCAEGKADSMEIEPVGDICVTFVDIKPWVSKKGKPHPLFTEQV